MPTLLESIGTRLARSRLGDSFGVERRDGSVVFVNAHDFRIDRDGRLIFYRSRNVAAYNAGEWTRVMRNLTPDDLQE